jgi:hypothetical protein
MGKGNDGWWMFPLLATLVLTLIGVSWLMTHYG